MSDANISIEPRRLTRALDWTIFSIGVLSLSIAIGATVLDKTTQVQTDAAPQRGDSLPVTL